MFCEKCGAQNDDGAKFCSSCGAVWENTAESQGETASVDEYVQGTPQSGGKDLKKLIIAVAAAVAAIIIVVCGIRLISGLFKSEVNYEKMPVVYVKEGGSMMLRNAGKKESYTLTEELGMSSYGQVQVTDDGKLVFFGSDYENGEFDLYYRKTNQKTPKGKNADEIGIKIDRGVSAFRSTENGDKVFYKKNEGLYVSNLKDESVKIDNNVASYALCDDEKTVLYLTGDGDLYVSGLREKDEPEKLESEVSMLVFPYDEDGNEIIEYKELYYLKDGNLYFKKDGKDREKVADDVAYVSYIGDTLYVATHDNVKVNINKSEMEIPVYTLYSVKGTKLKEVATELSQVSLYAQELKISRGIEGEKFKSSQEMLDLAKFAILKDDGKIVEFTDFDHENTNNITVSEDEKYLYCIEDYDAENGSGTLNRYQIKSKGLGNKESLCKNVANYDVYDKLIVVQTNDGENKALGVYRNGKYEKLTEEVYETVEVIDETTLYYLDDYDSEDNCGTLKRYKNGKIVEISDDVYSSDIEVRSDNMCYYLRDYSEEKYYGELFVNEGKKSKSIDNKVSSIVY